MGTNLLTIIASLNEYYNGSIDFEIIFRNNEPEVEIKAHASDNVTVSLYLSEDEANTIEEDFLKERLNFLISQEKYRRKVISERCILK